MDSETQQQLFEDFLDAAGAGERTPNESGQAEALADELRQIDVEGAPTARSNPESSTSGGAADPLAEAINEAMFQERAVQAGSGEASASVGAPAGSMGAGSFAATPAGSSTRGTGTSSGSTQSSGGSGSTVESAVTGFLESGLGIVPLISGLFGLFGGGSSAPPPLEKYSMPSPVLFASADIGDTLTGVDYDQMGLPRAYASGPATSGGGVVAGSGMPGGTTPASPAPAASGSSAGPQITVNVQAMDARSFLDRSSDIAEAVRSAMLNMSAINDVVNEI